MHHHTGLRLGLLRSAPQTLFFCPAPFRLLSPLLQIVCKGLDDPSQVVRNAALFALGQFSENLQVSKAKCRWLPQRTPPHPKAGDPCPVNFHFFRYCCCHWHSRMYSASEPDQASACFFPSPISAAIQRR